MHARPTYPGDLATVPQLITLACEYRGAAHDLLTRGKRKSPSSWAPARLLALQAIELQLNAFLLHSGNDTHKIRSLRHNLAERGDLAISSGLVLRKRTLTHLYELSSGREYLITRYGPELSGSWTQINRLIATLDEITIKVSSALTSPKTRTTAFKIQTSASRDSPKTDHLTPPAAPPAPPPSPPPFSRTR